MIKKVLIANRGEIARRVIRTARRLGVGAVAVYSDADEAAAHVEEADEAIRIGPPQAAQSYLRGAAIIEAARASSADAIHPGYGFLSENAAFAEAVIDAGLTWIGPHPQTIRDLGDKVSARRMMQAAGVPLNPGGEVESRADAARIAELTGFPVMVKAAAGGGGIGMRIVRSAEELWPVCERTRDQAERFFGDGSLLLERFMESARHVEVQILGLPDGTVVALGERDCSVQRRFQKVIEETPSPGISDDLRRRMIAAAIAGAERLGYKGAGTVECLVSGDDFVFLEVNARLQVEHPITELVTGIDIVEAQFRIAAGEQPAIRAPVQATGHAIELRIYAEDPVRFLPSPGRITAWAEPTGDGIRVDAGYRQGDTITPFYDPLIAKLCVHGADREQALTRAAAATQAFRIEGPKTNLPFLARVLSHDAFRSGAYDTGLVERMS